MRAERIFSLEHNKNRQMPPAFDEHTSAAWSRETTPATNVGDDKRQQSSSQIVCLRPKTKKYSARLCAL